MYCISASFLARMQKYIDEIEEKSAGLLLFEEYIPLPYFGNAVLRFNVCKCSFSLDDLDAYEAWMQDIVKDEFLVDFMGSVYQKVGFKPEMYEEKFRKCYYAYQSIPLLPQDYQPELIQDGISLLSKCGLATDHKVWEIQYEEDISLYLLGKENRKIGTFSFPDTTVHIFEVDEVPCVGLMRAILYAKEQHTSVVRVLLEI